MWPNKSLHVYNIDIVDMFFSLESDINVIVSYVYMASSYVNMVIGKKYDHSTILLFLATVVIMLAWLAWLDTYVSMISVKTIFLDYVCDDTTKTPVMVAIEWKLDLKDARYWWPWWASPAIKSARNIILIYSKVWLVHIVNIVDSVHIRIYGYTITVV